LHTLTNAKWEAKSHQDGPKNSKSGMKEERSEWLANFERRENVVGRRRFLLIVVQMLTAALFDEHWPVVK